MLYIGKIKIISLGSQQALNLSIHLNISRLCDIGEVTKPLKVRLPICEMGIAILIS